MIYGPACMYTSPIKIGDGSSNLLFISTLFSFHKKKKKIVIFLLEEDDFFARILDDT